MSDNDEEGFTFIDLGVIKNFGGSRIARIAVHADILVIELREPFTDFFAGVGEVPGGGGDEYFHIIFPIMSTKGLYRLGGEIVKNIF